MIEAWCQALRAALIDAESIVQDQNGLSGRGDYGKHAADSDRRGAQMRSTRRST
jgi:hypothetical protein